MNQRTKYITTLSVLWSIASLFLIAFINTNNYIKTHEFLLELALLTFPVWGYWLCIWLWGKIPTPTLSEKSKKRIQRLSHALLGITFVKVSHISFNVELSLLNQTLVTLLPLIIGYKLSQLIYTKSEGKVHPWVIIAVYLAILLSALGIDADQRIREQEISRYQTKYKYSQPRKNSELTKELSDMILDNLPDKDKNKYEEAGKQLFQEQKNGKE